MKKHLIIAGLLLTTMIAAAAAVNGPKLADAVMNGDKAAVASLMKQGVDVNVAQGDGTTALHWAAYHGDAELTRQLLKAGAGVKATTRIGGMSPLFMAAKSGSAEVIDILLKAGANVREANSNGTTVLMTAAATGNANAVKVLVDNGAEVNARDKTNGQTALMFAAALNSAASIKALMARGADPNITTKVVSLAKVEVDANGNPLPEQPQRGSGAARAQADRVFGASVVGGLAALHFATREGQFDAVKELVAGGANVNLQSAGDKTPPATEAIINGHLDIAQYLLDHGADPKISNADGLTPIYAAVDIKWRANAWYPQPTIAEEKTNYLDFIKDALDRGADINARLSRKLWYRKFRYGDDWVDPNGATAFFRAAQANDVEAMKFLAAHGADPKIATAKGVTPLMVAAGIGFEYQLTNIVPESRLATVKYLVDDLHVDVNAKDEKYFTALHGAAYVGDNEVIRYLAAKGADVKARAKMRLSGTQGGEDVEAGMGETVADMANGPREKSLLHPETVKLLMSLGSANSDDCRSTACVNKTKPDKPPVKP